MDQILADLLKTSGRTEQKVDDLSDLVKNQLLDHDRRLRRVEGLVGKVAALVTVVSIPVTYAVKLFTHRKTGA